MGDRWAGDTATTGNVSGAKHPRLWPATLEAEDAVRAAGHLTLTPGEWLQLYRDSSTVQYSTVQYTTVQVYRDNPSHLLVTTATRLLDRLGLLRADHPAYTALVRLAEMINII